METRNVGLLITKARTGARMTQEQLACAAGLSVSDIEQAERGELLPKQAQLRRIAKATGVTQVSLLNAARGISSGRRAAKKESSSPAVSERSAGTLRQAAGSAGRTPPRRTGAKKAHQMRFLKTPCTPYRVFLMQSRQKPKYHE